MVPSIQSTEIDLPSVRLCVWGAGEGRVGEFRENRGRESEMGWVERMFALCKFMCFWIGIIDTEHTEKTDVSDECQFLVIGFKKKNVCT